MRYLRLIITDTMSFWDDNLGDYLFDPANSKTLTRWYRVPAEWLAPGGRLVPQRSEQLLQHLYGSAWRSGNGDGSKYVILEIAEQVLTDLETARRIWAATEDSCYAVSESGKVEKVVREAL